MKVLIYLLAMAKVVDVGLATVSLAGAGVGIDIVFGSLILSYYFNLEEKDQFFSNAILGFALTESIALFIRFNNVFFAFIWNYIKSVKALINLDLNISVLYKYSFAFFLLI